MKPRNILILVLVIAVIAAVVWFAPQTFSGALSGDAAPPPSSSSATPEASTNGIPTAATGATIEYVHDGDTLFLVDGRKVRMLGINTPEIGENAECYGPEATAALRAMLPEGEEVWVLEDVEPLDQYGRSLLFIYLDDGTNVNIEMLELGAAEVEMYAPNYLLRDELEMAEDAAYSARVGIWASC